MVPVPIGKIKSQAMTEKKKKTTVNRVQLMLLHPNPQLLRDLESREKFSSSIQKSINLVARRGSDTQITASLGALD